MKPLQRAQIVIPPEKRERLIQDNMKAFHTTREEVEKVLADAEKKETWMNDVYQVTKTTVGAGLAWLSIKRIDQEVCHDWRDFQQIKNQLVGPECEGVEMYTAESRLVDTSNQYHLWVFTNPKYRFPWGFDTGRFILNESTRDSKQRPYTE